MAGNNFTEKSAQGLTCREQGGEVDTEGLGEEKKINTEEAIRFLEEFRRDILYLINERFDSILADCTTENAADTSQTKIHQGALGGQTGVFKGKRPVSVTLPNGDEHEVKTWKQVALLILQDCDSNPQSHEKLMAARNRVFGRQRTILADSENGMQVPLKISDGLYFEAKFDTETLLTVLRDRVLRYAGYDYSRVEIRYLEP